MKKLCYVLSLMILLVLTGCRQQEIAETIAETSIAKEAMTEAMIATKEETAVPETTEPKHEEPPELWFPPVTQGVNMYFPCLLDNFSSETLTVKSLQVVYSLNGAEV